MKTIFCCQKPRRDIYWKQLKCNSPYPSMPHFEITTQEVYNILNECNPNKSPGPDKLHPYALKATAAEISPMLTHIFQQSLHCGRLPTQ